MSIPTSATLTDAQNQVICALSTGATISAAAQAAGVHRNTVAYWRDNSSGFRGQLENALYDRALQHRDRYEELASDALQAIRELLNSGATPPSVRLKAALAILQGVSAPLPEPPAANCGPYHPAEASPEHTTPESHSSQIELPPHVIVREDAPRIVHKNAQTAQQPYRREAPKVGRNDNCPCGSGRKYKRCCLAQNASAQSVTQAAAQH